MVDPAAPAPGRRPTGTRRTTGGDAPRTPPPRPQLTSDIPRPLADPEPPRPRTATAAAVLWLGACAAGAVGVGAALADGGALRDRLAATARESDPTATAELVDDGVSATLLLVLGGVALLALVALAAVLLFLRRRRWTWWLLLAVGPLTAVAADVAQSVVSGGADVDRTAFLVQLALVLPALVALLLPATRRWVRPARG